MHQEITDQYFKTGEEKLCIAQSGSHKVYRRWGVHPDILSAYWRYGFYVLEGLIQQGEVDNLVADFNEVMDRAPKNSKTTLDAKGRPSVAAQFERATFQFAKPLSDPYGWNRLNGRSLSNKNERV